MATGLVGSIALQTCPDCLSSLTPDDSEGQNEEFNPSGLIGFKFLCLACHFWDAKDSCIGTWSSEFLSFLFLPLPFSCLLRDLFKKVEGNFIHEDYFKIKIVSVWRWLKNWGAKKIERDKGSGSKFWVENKNVWCVGRVAWVQVDTIRRNVKRNRESLESLESSTDAHSVDTWRLFSQGKKKEQHLATWEKKKSKTKPRRYKVILLTVYLGRKQPKQQVEGSAELCCPEAPCLHSLIQSCTSHSWIHSTVPLAPAVHPLHKPVQCFLMEPVLGNAQEDMFPVYTVIPWCFTSSSILSCVFDKINVLPNLTQNAQLKIQFAFWHN